MKNSIYRKRIMMGGGVIVTLTMLFCGCSVLTQSTKPDETDWNSQIPESNNQSGNSDMEFTSDDEPDLAYAEGEGSIARINLPEGYYPGDYSAYLGEAGGFLIYPELYATGEDGAAPESWRYSGFVGETYQGNADFHYVDGVPDGELFLMHNHTVGEVKSVLQFGDQPVIEEYLVHDLYTAPEIEELPADTVTTSSYWYFFYANEGAEKLYYISLAADRFTEEEAIEIARSAVFHKVVYVTDFDGKTLAFDEVEWVAVPGVRATELGITQEDAPGGFVVYDATTWTEQLSLADDCSISILNWSGNYEQMQVTPEELTSILKEREGLSIPYHLEIKDNKIISITEQYMP